MKKVFIKFFALFFFILGTIGIFIPLLPTVPFYLLTALLLSKLSRRELVKLKKIHLLGKISYPYIKKSLRALKRWSTQPQNSYTS